MVGQLKGFEKHICSSWDAWDQPDTFALQVYNPVFIEGVLPDEVIKRAYASGRSTLVIDGQTSSLQVYDNEGEVIYDKPFKIVIED